MIGHSWGAWLCWLTAAKYPHLVKMLILVASGPFEACYAAQIEETRLSRLNRQEVEEIHDLMYKIMNAKGKASNKHFKRFGFLFSKADSYDPLEGDENIDFRPDIYKSVWPLAVQMRESGELLNLGQSIKCPVAAIHGDYDPHPAEGVEKPLSRVLEGFKIHLLPQCGHYPWKENRAREEFFRILVNLV